MRFQLFLSRLLNVRLSESAGVLGMLGHAFFSGLGIALSFTAVNVLLLENHGSERLPVIYAISAIILLVGGFIYSKLEHKISPVKLFPAILVFSAIWAVSARGLTQEGESPLLLAAVYCSYFLIYQINNLEFWGAAALLYDVRQSKRLFGLLAAGESVAKILGYAITPVFIAAFSLDDLMYLAAGAFLISALILFKIVKKEKESFKIEHHALEKHSHHDEKQTKILGAFQFLRSLKSDGFMRNVAIFAMFSTMVYYAMHYAFLTEVEEQFHELEDLAFFFGLFFSIAKALNLVIKSLLSGRMLNAVGIRLLIIMLPITLTVINLIGISGFFALDNPIKFFLWIFGFNMLADEIMRSSLHKPSYLTLFQPLQKNKRLEGHTIAKGIMEPIGMGIAGVTILLLYYFDIFKPSTFIIYILTFVLAWLISSFFVSREYRSLLSRALKGRLLSRQNISFSREELNMLRNEKLASGDNFEKLYAIKMLKDYLPTSEYNVAVEQLLAAKDEQILSESLNLLENSADLYFKNAVKNLLFHPNKEISKKAIYCYCAMLEEECVDELMPYFEVGSDELKEGILGGILKYTGIYGATIAGDTLLQWIGSENPKLRGRVARLIGDIGKVDYYHPLIQLIQDPDPEVQKEAIIASGKVGNKKLIGPILEKAGDKHLFNICLRTLEKMGESAIPHLENAVHQTTDIRLIRKFIRIASKIPGSKTNRFLVSQLQSQIFTIRNEALYSLHLLQYKSGTLIEKNEIEEQMKKEIATFKLLSSFPTQLEEPGGLPVNDSLKHEIRMIQFRVLYLLGFIYDQTTLNKVIDSLKTGQHHFQSNACELLENLLKRTHAHAVVPLIEFDTHKGSFEKHLEKHQHTSMCESLWTLSPGMVSDWLTALSIRCHKITHKTLSDVPVNLLNSAKSIAIKQELQMHNL